jgi:SEC-C motif domain protein
MAVCYCGSNQDYSVCCGLYIEKNQVAPSPEALMRSRYSAYAQAKIDYIMATMRGAPLKGFEAASAKAWAESCEWVGLTVLKARYNPSDPLRGIVEFKAYYRLQNTEHCMHEKSLFQRIAGRWFYIGTKV